MVYSIKKHEVDRLLNVTVALGWELVEEIYSVDEVWVKVKKKISPELLKASGELDIVSRPQ